MQIIKQTTGNKLAIGIIGNREEAEIMHNRIFNFGGTNGQLHELSNEENGKAGFYYFFAGRNDTFRALVEGIRQKIYLAGGAKKWKKNPVGFCFSCMMAAGREIQSWHEENFLGNTDASRNFHKVLSGGAPFWEE